MEEELGSSTGAFGGASSAPQCRTSAATLPQSRSSSQNVRVGMSRSVFEARLPSVEICIPSRRQGNTLV
eukprot:m.125355 g.125355  ORF g.125355 m.125355 type:complete len:69 (+) comp52205_c2_seq23:93-299(+)